MPESEGRPRFGPARALVRQLAEQLSNPRGALGWLMGRVMDRANHRITQRSLELLEVGTADTVLDVGFGGGRSLGALLRTVRRGVVHGLEQSTVSLWSARRRYAAAVRAGRLVLTHGTAASLPWPTHSVDRVMTVNTLYFWPDATAELSELRRVLRPSGRLVIAYRPAHALRRLPMAAHGFHFRTDDEVLQLLASADLEVLAVEFDDTQGREHVCVVARPRCTCEVEVSSRR